METGLIIKNKGAATSVEKRKESEALSNMGKGQNENVYKTSTPNPSRYNTGLSKQHMNYPLVFFINSPLQRSGLRTGKIIDSTPNCISRF
ncbi:hypothetical protein [Microbacter margulisiae]|uniref:Uncharacterized protein n=1 Tax=Microbacter margulisiae TaxID=1350067 RepID=A0A7W5DTV2_9PORP|nr:hypothetical protein [Microbacter margulisiae]MBB3188469.1 hypothetical protein [Microbacter margulisiae]